MKKIKKLKHFFYLRPLVWNYEKETAEKFKEIYSSGKSPDSPGSFGFEGRGEKNSRIISKNRLE